MWPNFQLCFPASLAIPVSVFDFPGDNNVKHFLNLPFLKPDCQRILNIFKNWIICIFMYFGIRAKMSI